MPVDLDLLRSLATTDDPRTGIRERFCRLSLRSGATVGVLTEPLGPSAGLGFLVCHSFAREQAELMPAEGQIARALAARGFAALRFQCQGYGDSEHPELRATPRTHLEDSLDAFDAFGELARVDRIGLVGTRVGAAIAVALAQERDVAALVAVAPILNGRRYVDQVIRGLVMTRIAMRSRAVVKGPETAEAIRALLDQQGFLDHKGYVLTREVVEELARLDALDALRTAPAESLLVQISVSQRPQLGMERLATALGGVGSRVERAVVTHPQAALYGLRHVRIVARDQTADVFADLHVRVAEAVGGWAAQRFGDRG